MPWHDDETILGPKQSLTAEGFLLCKDVPLARVGMQEYHPLELPFDVRGDADYGAMMQVDRPAAEVFDPDSIRSFQGRPIIDEHPDDFIGPDNIGEHQIGTVLNVRRGEPPDDDVLLGDMLFTSRRGIDLVRRGKRAVSVGYDASYIATGRNRARQMRIRANHIALVDEARCGSRCMIGDRAPRKEKVMRSRDSVGSEHNAWANDPLKNRSNTMGERPGPVGPSLIMTLPGPASAYFILDLPPGDRCAVVATAGINGKLDMSNQVAEGTGPLPRPANRTVDQQRREMVARDAAWSQQTLRGINEANRRFWAQNSGKA
jgi:hypothetical protein